MVLDAALPRLMLACAMASASLACGSRTSLVEDGLGPASAPPASTSPDASSDAVDDDRSVPPLDTTRRGADRSDCPDAGSTLVYVVTQTGDLLGFHPPSSSFTRIGHLTCPEAQAPYSMAVDRKGTAFVEYADGRLFRVSTADASCSTTPYGTTPNQATFHHFGMGFMTVGAGPAEELFVLSNLGELATLDTSTFELGSPRLVQPSVLYGELTGSGDGRLYAFSHPDGASPASMIAEIAPASGTVVGVDLLPTVAQGDGWAFAAWGGAFYLFTAPGGHQETYRYDPATREVTLVASYPAVIVGAGVSTCAPQGR